MRLCVGVNRALRIIRIIRAIGVMRAKKVIRVSKIVRVIWATKLIRLKVVRATSDGGGQREREPINRTNPAIPDTPRSPHIFDIPN